MFYMSITCFLQVGHYSEKCILPLHRKKGLLLPHATILLISVNMQAVPLICKPNCLWEWDCHKTGTTTQVKTYHHKNLHLNHSLLFALLSHFPPLDLLRFFHLNLNNNWLNLVKYTSILSQRNSFSPNLDKTADSLFLIMHHFCCSKFATTVF